MLDVTNNLCGFRAFVEVDQLRGCKRWDTVLDERQVREVDAYVDSVSLNYSS